MALEDMAEELGNMLLLARNSQFEVFLRAGHLKDNVWINEVELPNIIDELMFGKFSDFSHAQAYGRLLRIKLLKYLSEREYVLEIEELGRLADSLNMYREDLPESLQIAFEEAADEGIDCLDLNDVPKHSDPESTVNDWLEQMDKIDGYFGRSVNSSKREEFDQFLGSIQIQHEMEMDQQRDDWVIPPKNGCVEN